MRRHSQPHGRTLALGDADTDSDTAVLAGVVEEDERVQRANPELLRVLEHCPGGLAAYSVRQSLSCGSEDRCKLEAALFGVRAWPKLGRLDLLAGRVGIVHGCSEMLCVLREALEHCGPCAIILDKNTRTKSPRDQLGVKQGWK